MLVLVKILAVFALMVALIRRKVNVGAALIAGALAIGVLFEMGATGIAGSFVKTAAAPRTLNLVAVVLGLTLLGNVLRHMENLARVVEGLSCLVGDVRVVMASIPAFIGFMPMPGGAMLSAPLTGEVADKIGLSADTKTVLNYWFRHVWEYMFPLYPAVVVSAALLDVGFRDIIITNGPLSLAAIFVGWLLILRPIKASKGAAKRRNGGCFMVLAVSIWPVAAVIAGNIIFGVNLVLCLAAVLFVLLIQSRFFAGFGRQAIKESITLNLVVLIYSVMLFQTMIEEAGAVEGLPQVFQDLGVPVPLILFTVPFIVGALTGITVAAVGATFPLLSIFMMNGSVDLSSFLLAYMGAFMGVMVSPVHLCLVLSREYYGGDFNRVYWRLMPLVGFVVAAAVLLYAAGWPAQLLS